MGLSKIKNRLFSTASTSNSHDLPGIHTSSDSKEIASPSLPGYHKTTAKKPWVPWMPKEPYSMPAASGAKTDIVSEKPKSDEVNTTVKKWEVKLGVSDVEKTGTDEERRATVRAYLRNDRDKARYALGGI